MRRFKCNLFLTPVHSCKHDVKQRRKYDVANLLPKRPGNIVMVTFFKRCINVFMVLAGKPAYTLIMESN